MVKEILESLSQIVSVAYKQRFFDKKVHSPSLKIIIDLIHLQPHSFTSLEKISIVPWVFKTNTAILATWEPISEASLEGGQGDQLNRLDFWKLP